MRNIYPRIPPLHLICGNDDLRPTLQHIYFENKKAYATNAYALTISNIEDFMMIHERELSLLHGRFIHASAWEQICKGEVISVSENGISVGIKQFIADFRLIQKDELKPIDFKKVINNINSAKESNSHVYGYDSKFIDIISKIIGQRRLYFCNKGSAGTVIKGDSSSSTTAILMPINTDFELLTFTI